MDTYSLPAEKKGLEFVARTEDIPEYVWVDRVRLLQFLSNLIGNSLKFTEEGRIVFAVHREREDEQGMCKLSFSVSDTGIGVPEQELEKIFQAFEQSSAAYNHHMRGTGLGLSLSQRFVQLMGGEGISVTSRESRGSIFQFTLRLKIGDGSNVKEEKVRESREISSGLSALKILAAEDNYVNRELLQKMFEALGIRDYRLAENGGEVINILENDSGYWDVVLLDLEMPVMDGREVMERMRAREFETGIVIMSAHAQEDTREKCRRLGVRDFISKPYSLNRLREVLERFALREPDLPGERTVLDVCRDYLKKEYDMPEEDIREIIRATAENMEKSIQSMDEGLKGGDFKVVRRDAHYIKGMLANIGLEQLSALAGSIQKAAEQGREDDCRFYLNRLCSRGEEFLKK
jgi:CheY-like chemotaxis protein